MLVPEGPSGGVAELHGPDEQSADVRGDDAWLLHEPLDAGLVGGGGADVGARTEVVCMDLTEGLGVLDEELSRPKFGIVDLER